jgi:hypothetical protein
MPNDQIALETGPGESVDERLQALADADLEMIRGQHQPGASFDNGFDNGFDNSFQQPTSPPQS